MIQETIKDVGNIIFSTLLQCYTCITAKGNYYVLYIRPITLLFR